MDRASRPVPAIERIAQRGLHRPQPWLVMSPGIDPVAIDRAAHLLGAWRGDGALVAMRGQAGVVERQAKIVDQPPRLPFRIVD